MKPGPSGLLAFKNRNFLLYWLAQLVSMLGTWMQTVGLSWLVLRWTNSPKALGVVLACQFAPSLILSLPGGVLADRVDKRKLLFLTQAVLMLQAFALAAVATMKSPHVLWLYLLAVLAGVATALDGPTRQAFVPEIVTPEELPSAIALNSAQFNLSRMVGPALGGLLVAGYGEAVCFAANGVSFLAVLVALLAMRTVCAPQAKPAGNLLQEIPAGLRYAMGEPDLSLVMLTAAVVGVFALQFNAILPLVAKYQLQTGSAGFGLLTSIVGVGSMVCALVVVAVGKGGRLTMLAGAAGMGAAVLALGVFGKHWVIYVLLFVWGYTDIMFFNTAMAQMQIVSVPEMRGRVNALYLLLINGTSPLGSLLVGYMAAHMGLQPALQALGAMCLAGIALGAGYSFLQRQKVASSAGENTPRS